MVLRELLQKSVELVCISLLLHVQTRGSHPHVRDPDRSRGQVRQEGDRSPPYGSERWIVFAARARVSMLLYLHGNHFLKCLRQQMVQLFKVQFMTERHT